MRLLTAVFSSYTAVIRWLYLPAHHDHSFGTWLDLGLEPLFLKLSDELPGTKFAAPHYRSAMCIATSGAKRGTIVKMRY